MAQVYENIFTFEIKNKYLHLPWEDFQTQYWEKPKIETEIKTLNLDNGSYEYSVNRRGLIMLRQCAGTFYHYIWNYWKR